MKRECKRRERANPIEMLGRPRDVRRRIGLLDTMEGKHRAHDAHILLLASAEEPRHDHRVTGILLPNLS
jgi:hypothetical protein